MEGPEGLDASFRYGVTTDERHQRADGGSEQAGIALHQHPDGIEAYGLIRMREGGDQRGNVGLSQIRDGELSGRFVLDTIDAAEIVFAIRADGGTGLTVLRATRVIVGDDRRIEIEHVHRAVRADTQGDRTEPVVGRTEPLLVLQEEAAFVGGSV